MSRVFPYVAWALFAGWILSACASTGSENDVIETDTITEDSVVTDVAIVDTTLPDDIENDTAPDVPVLQWNDAVEPVWTQSLLEEPVTWIGTGPGHTLLAAHAEQLWRIDGSEVQPIETEGVLAPGEIVTMAHIPDGTLLISTGQGLYALTGTTLSPSPLNELLQDVTINTLVSGGDKDQATLWIGASDGIHLWRDNQLSKVSPEGVDVTSAKLAKSATSPLWIGSGDNLYRLEKEKDGFALWLEREALAAEHVVVDASSRVWVTHSSGVEWLPQEGNWETVASDIVNAYGHSEANAVWLLSETAWWQINGNEAQKTDAPLTVSVSAVDGNGNLILATKDGLIRVGGGRKILLDNFPEEAVIAGEVTLTVQPEMAEQVTSVTVTLDGDPVELSEAWSFSVDATSLAEGSHQLVVSVAYDDLTAISSQQFPFESVHVTWSEDIEPLNLDHCAGCHGNTGNVKIKLSTREEWETLYGAVMIQVEAGMMPPGSGLAPDLIKLIEYWGRAGYPE